MKLSASIMAHPDRTAVVGELLTQLDREVPVYWDPEGRASGKGDRVWRTARAAWQMADPEADWHVLIQDDALPCADLLAGLERALETVPRDAVVCPYLGKGRTVPRRWENLARRASAEGASWVRSEKLMWGVCIVAPVHLLPEMIAWADRRAGVADDMRVAGWIAHRQGEVWYPWPSLVDHKPVPSLTKHRAADRRAQRHHEGSALSLSWSGPVVTDPMLKLHRGPRSGPTSQRKGTLVK